VSRDDILSRLRERIVVFAASHLSRDVAEDVAQEVLIVLHEKYAHLDRLEDLLPLSLQIVRFKIMSLRRKAARRGEYTQVSVTDIPLPGKTFPEIQKIMGAAAINTVYTWDHRCRKNLLDLLGGDWEARRR
jgi:RNA polymerase sigma-70 factor (ECF subfamily)